MDQIITKIKKDLKQNADEATRLSGQRFFKEAVKFYGVKSAVAEKIGKQYFKEVKDLPKAELFKLCEELWRSGYMEEAFIACHWSYYIHKNYTEKDLAVFHGWVKKYVTNWATCDTLCNHTVGEFLMMYPQHIQELSRWAISNDRWLKRAAAVSLIIPARKGLFQKEIIAIAEILLLDTDDLVQKGYGWMLKAASQYDQKLIFDFVMSKKAIMPRTALRYAIEKMPKDLKQKAMAK